MHRQIIAAESGITLTIGNATILDCFNHSREGVKKDHVGSFNSNI